MIEENNERFYNNEEKLDFIIKYLKLNVTEIANLWGVQPNYISKLREHTYDSLKPMHLYAFSSSFNIPFEVFDKNIKYANDIKMIIENQNRVKETSIFNNNEHILKTMEGEWFAYFYPSNQFAEVYSIKTTIHSDGTVTDENKNGGKLLIGQNQSIIVKEAFNSKNLVVIVFDNHQVAYNMFHFSLVSKRNHVNREMLNFGFFSRKEIEPDLVKEVLGDKEHLQLKMKCDFVERISEYVEILG